MTNNEWNSEKTNKNLRKKLEPIKDIKTHFSKYNKIDEKIRTVWNLMKAITNDTR